MIDPWKTFYIRGMPVPWHQIAEYWESLLERNPQKAKAFGDPYWSEKACWKIASEILSPYINGVGGTPISISDWENPNLEEPKVETNRGVVLKDDIDWLDQSDVFKRALEELEQKHKKEREKQEEAANFWRTQKENPKATPPPPEPVEEVSIEWRKVLQISSDSVVTEDIIKRAFRKRALQCHPDKGGSEKLMKELLHARDLAYYYLGMDPP
jgi:hypothetical protein